MKAVDILWDIDIDDDEVTPESIGLPSEVEIPDDMDEDEIEDYLSDLTGYCHSGYRLVDGD